MKLTILRESILKPLQSVCSIVEQRPSQPILSSILLSVENEILLLTGTDLEIEIIAHTQIKTTEQGKNTLPARKFMDICKTLPEGAVLDLEMKDGKAMIQSGRSRYVLATLDASDFPNLDPMNSSLELTLPQRQLKYLIQKTQFAMAHQDVRYYLNGLLLELTQQSIRAVATDGHRLAMSELRIETNVDEKKQVIVPRKGILELARLLHDNDEPVHLQLDQNHIKASLQDISFTSKLIDGKFPDYTRVLPQETTITLSGNRGSLCQAFSRASVLCNEKYRGMRLHISDGLLRATVQNPEQEKAEEEIEIDYQGEEFEIGFNIIYFLDALNAIDTEQVTIKMFDANSSCLIQGIEDNVSQYVIMPMRL